MCPQGEKLVPRMEQNDPRLPQSRHRAGPEPQLHSRHKLNPDGVAGARPPSRPANGLEAHCSPGHTAGLSPGLPGRLLQGGLLGPASHSHCAFLVSGQDQAPGDRAWSVAPMSTREGAAPRTRLGQKQRECGRVTAQEVQEPGSRGGGVRARQREPRALHLRGGSQAGPSETLRAQTYHRGQLDPT